MFASTKLPRTRVRTRPPTPRAAIRSFCRHIRTTQIAVLGDAVSARTLIPPPSATRVAAVILVPNVVVEVEHVTRIMNIPSETHQSIRIYVLTNRCRTQHLKTTFFRPHRTGHPPDRCRINGMLKKNKLECCIAHINTMPRAKSTPTRATPAMLARAFFFSRGRARGASLASGARACVPRAARRVGSSASAAARRLR